MYSMLLNRAEVFFTVVLKSVSLPEKGNGGATSKHLDTNWASILLAAGYHERVESPF